MKMVGAQGWVTLEGFSSTRLKSTATHQGHACMGAEIDLLMPEGTGLDAKH
jgi:hypothetical protein